jgi:hypothetical protein
LNITLIKINFKKDDVFWKEEEGKDFDAETADDLDVDMSGYYGDAQQADKDGKEMLEMSRLEMLRAGADPSHLDEKGYDKKDTRNPFHDSSTEADKIKKKKERTDFGRRVLEKAGWRDGEPIGVASRGGLVSALDASDGKTPLDKTGIGYHGPSVDRQRMVSAQKARWERQRRAEPYYIASKFDAEPSAPDTLLRRNEYPMKHK